MNKIAVVVLNYLNHRDTRECVNSILELKDNISGIVVVDNYSTNQSFDILKETYSREKKIRVIRTARNLGYAKGNNIGINLARKYFKAEFVLVVNNDTVLMDREYVCKMLSAYRKGIGVIGSNVRLKDGHIEKDWYVNVELPGMLKDYFLWLMIGLGFTTMSRYIDNTSDGAGRRLLMKGSALMLTPDYFRYYDGFYPYTFFYCEESILYLRCLRYGLVQKKVKNTEIYHKEERSSYMSFSNDCIIQSKYMFKSQKYVIWNWILNKVCQNKWGKQRVNQI